VDVEASAPGKAELKRINPRGSVPTFVIDGRVKVGFSPGSLRGMIRAAAERRIRH
jgi:glutathione S-transferase